MSFIVVTLIFASFSMLGHRYFGALITERQYKYNIKRTEKAKTVSRNSTTTVGFYAVVLRDSSSVTNA